MSNIDASKLSKTVGLKNIAPEIDFKDQTVLVTGGAAGIGAALVRALHKLGAHVIAVDIQEDKLNELESELGSRVKGIRFDLSEEDKGEYEQLAKDIVSSSPSGLVDAFIISAGVVKLSNGYGISGTPSWEFRKLSQINAKCNADIFRELLPHLASDARILVTSSPIVGRSDVKTPGYAISKGELEAIANNMAGELENTDMKVLGYVPPPVQNFLRTDLKPNEPLHAHPHGEDIAELPLRLISRSVRDEFNGKVIAMAYSHLRKTDKKTAQGHSFDYMPRNPETNGFVYDLRTRDFAVSGGDDGDMLMWWDTDSSRKILGLGRTPDMDIDKPLKDIYKAPEHVAKFREPK